MDFARSLGLLALSTVVLSSSAHVGCVDDTFADGVFLCDPASGAESCPPGLTCAADGRCRRRDIPGSGGGAGGTGGTAPTGGTTTTTSTSTDGGGGAGAGGGGGTGAGATGGGGGCVPKTCAVDYPGICGLRDDGCGSQIDCGCAACSGTQTRAPLLVENSSNLGTIAWDNENLAAVEDGLYAVAPGMPPQAETHRLYGYLYSFDIPAQAAIDSISLRVVRRGVGPGTIVDQAVRLMLHSTQPVGNDKSSASPWPEVFTSATYTWNQSGVTVAQLTANSFGAAVRAKNSHSSSNAAARVDYLELTVTYSCP